MAAKESPLMKAINESVETWLKGLGNLDDDFLGIVKVAIDEGDWSDIAANFYDECLDPAELEHLLLDKIQEVIDELEVTVKFKKVVE